MVYINEAINTIVNSGVKRKDIAKELEVSPALISTWLQEGNDFTPRFGVAQKIYKVYGIQIYPYAVEALDDSLPTSN